MTKTRGRAFDKREAYRLNYREQISLTYGAQNQQKYDCQQTKR